MSTIWRPSGIRLELRNSGEAAEIWLADDGHLEQVQHELQQFLVDPLNRRYQAASWQTGHTDAGLHYQSESYLHTLRSKAGPLTLGVMVLCIAVYILMQALGDDTVMYWLSGRRTAANTRSCGAGSAMRSCISPCCISCLT